MKHDEHYFAKRGYSIVFTCRNRRQCGQSYIVEYVNLVLWSIADRIVHIEHDCKLRGLALYFLCYVVYFPGLQLADWGGSVEWLPPAKRCYVFFFSCCFCVASFTCLLWFVPKILCLALWFFGGLKVMKIMASFLRLIWLPVNHKVFIIQKHTSWRN